MSNQQTEEEVFEFLNSLPENNGQPVKDAGKPDEDILDFLDELEAKEKDGKTKTVNKKQAPAKQSSEPAAKKVETKPVQEPEPEPVTEQTQQEEPKPQESLVNDPITSFSSWWSKEGSSKVSSQFSSLWGTAESALNYAKEQNLENNLKKAFHEIGITGVLEGDRELTDDEKQKLLKLPDTKQALDSLNKGFSLLSTQLNTALEKIQHDIDANRDEILDVKLVHDLKNYKKLTRFVKNNFEGVMRSQVDGDIQVTISESGILSSSAEAQDHTKSLGLFAGKLSDGEKLIHANIESVIKSDSAKEQEENPEIRKSQIYIGLLAISLNKEDEPAEETDILTIDEYQPSSFSFTAILIDKTHNLTIVNRSQPFPLKWANWLDGKFADGEANEEVDPSEWVVEWVNKGLDMIRSGSSEAISLWSQSTTNGGWNTFSLASSSKVLDSYCFSVVLSADCKSITWSFAEPRVGNASLNAFLHCGFMDSVCLMNLNWSPVGNRSHTSTLYLYSNPFDPKSSWVILDGGFSVLLRDDLLVAFCSRMRKSFVDAAIFGEWLNVRPYRQINLQDGDGSLQILQTLEHGHDKKKVTFTAYQIARAACTYNVGEIVVLDVPEDQAETESNKTVFKDTLRATSESTLLLVSLLQFFVTPSYLVQSVFKASVTNNFKFAKKLPKISTLPYMQSETASHFKEGLTVPKKSSVKKNAAGKVVKKKKPTTTKYVNIGSKEMFELDKEVAVNVRVTVDTQSKKVVSSKEAYGEIGALNSFGYHVRVATKFTSLFTEPGYPQGYDKCVYVSSGDYFSKTLPPLELANYEKNAEDQRLLLVVSKWKDIERSFAQDTIDGVTNPQQMMDSTLPIPLGTRVEDGVLIALNPSSGVSEDSDPWAVAFPIGSLFDWVIGVRLQSTNSLWVRHHGQNPTVRGPDTGDTVWRAVRVERVLLGRQTVVVHVSCGSESLVDELGELGLLGTEMRSSFSVCNRDRNPGATHAVEEDQRHLRVVLHNFHSAHSGLVLFRLVSLERWPVLGSWNQLLDLGQELTSITRSKRERVISLLEELVELGSGLLVVQDRVKAGLLETPCHLLLTVNTLLSQNGNLRTVGQRGELEIVLWIVCELVSQTRVLVVQNGLELLVSALRVVSELLHVVGSERPNLLQFTSRLGQNGIAVIRNSNLLLSIKHRLSDNRNKRLRHAGSCQNLHKIGVLISLDLEHSSKLLIEQSGVQIVLDVCKVNLQTASGSKSHLQKSDNKTTVRSVVVSQDIKLFVQSQKSTDKALEHFGIMNSWTAVTNLVVHLCQSRSTKRLGHQSCQVNKNKNRVVHSLQNWGPGLRSVVNTTKGSDDQRHWSNDLLLVPGHLHGHRVLTNRDGNTQFWTQFQADSLHGLVQSSSLTRVAGWSHPVSRKLDEVGALDVCGQKVQQRFSNTHLGRGSGRDQSQSWFLTHGKSFTGGYHFLSERRSSNTNIGNGNLPWSNKLVSVDQSGNTSVTDGDQEGFRTNRWELENSAQCVINSGFWSDLNRRKFGVLDLFKQVKILLSNTKNKSFLRFVTPDLQWRHSWLKRQDLTELELGSQIVIMDKFWQSVGQSTSSNIVDTLNWRVGSVSITSINHLLCSSLHLWVTSLNRGKVKVCRSFTRSNRGGSTSSKTNQHRLSSQDNDSRAWSNLVVGLESQLRSDSTHTTSNHNWLVESTELFLVVCVGDLGSQGSEVTGNTRSSKLVVERSRTQWGLDHDVQWRGNVGRLSNIELPRLGEGWNKQVGDRESRQSTLGLGTTAHSSLVSNFSTRTSGSTRERRHCGWMVVSFHLDQSVHGLIFGAPFESIFSVWSEKVSLGSVENGRVITVGTDSILWMEFVSIPDHLEKRQIFLLSVNFPVSVENLVSAVFGVDLSEHEQFHISWVSSKLFLESLHQVRNFSLIQGQSQFLVGCEKIVFGRNQINICQWFWLMVFEKVIVDRNMIINVQRLSHSVVNRTQTAVFVASEVLQDREARSHLQQDGHSSFDSVDLIS
ncbi:hypothetical protein OGAPHI_002702 [Ogataea philodendri]|uniref:Uncharacterized protein n=1 Tax=Ogataea philodendri TaxID=1378263 RepID=A0A9P8PBR5_9ASCO|nr:uncharacterized protein OGAPHI_002702 [Ogataea philodendri]KAH3668947.1 hypothetical protein OGAPHI_002702 [Ogataea philodendri]